MSLRHLKVSIVIILLIIVIRVISALGSPSPSFLFLDIVEWPQVPRVVMRVIVRQLDLLVVRNHNSFLHYRLIMVIKVIRLLAIHCATIPDREDHDNQQKNHKEVGESHTRSVIDIWMIVEMIVVVHVIVVNKDYRRVEVIVVSVEPTIGIVAAISCHSCGRAVARSVCWLNCSIIAVRGC